MAGPRTVANVDGEDSSHQPADSNRETLDVRPEVPLRWTSFRLPSRWLKQGC